MCVCVLCCCVPPPQLSELYGVPPCADPRQFLSHLARRQGRLRPGGLPDPHAAAVALLRDWTRWVRG